MFNGVGKKTLRKCPSNFRSSKRVYVCSVAEDTSHNSGNILPLPLQAQPTVILNHLDLYSTEQER